jgi:hypothetical protein
MKIVLTAGRCDDGWGAVLGGKLPWRHLVGLEHRFKDVDRVKERIADDIRVKGRTVREAFATLGDPVRFTFE